MVNKPAPEQSPDSHERHRLYQENKNLRSQLKALLESASDYRSSQRRFETFELKLLNCQYFYELIDCLIVDITHDFKLDAVSLTLFDPEHIAQEMLKKNPIDSDNLRFEDNYSELLRPLRELQSKNILPGGDLSRMRPQLSRNTGFIELARFPQTAIRSMALLPLLRQQTLVGYLCLGSYNRDRFNPDLATELVNHLAAIIAVCIENILSKEQLHQLSQIDMLTRVKNRRAFERDMHREISRSKRETTPLSCLFVDLDHFKKINDTLGHLWTWHRRQSP